jgi:L-seryl-tRNA(Ser) seleniumtransferase
MNTLPPSAGVDRFGFPIDPTVGYARGRILGSPLDETRRLRHAWSIAHRRFSTHGASAFADFTGNVAELPIGPEDLPLCEEWVGQSVAMEGLRPLVLEHLGGRLDRHGFAVLTRTSGAIFTWLNLYGAGSTALSIVPAGGHGHSSLHHAARSCRSRLVEVEADKLDEAFIDEHRPAVAVITSVTSSLEELDGAQLRRAAGLLNDAGCLTLLDDAYGARMRPIVHGGPKSLEVGVDVAVTNGDKLGLAGPRCCFVVGDPELVMAMETWAAQMGLDGRAPAIAGALAALQRFTPQLVWDDIEDGRLLSDALTRRFGETHVSRTVLGPTIGEESALQLLLERYGPVDTGELRPCEITAAVSMLLLESEGIVTVNALSHPGSRVALRLKPTRGSLSKVGGGEPFADALEKAFESVSRHARDSDAIRRLIMGGQ